MLLCAWECDMLCADVSDALFAARRGALVESHFLARRNSAREARACRGFARWRAFLLVRQRTRAFVVDRVVACEADSLRFALREWTGFAVRECAAEVVLRFFRRHAWRIARLAGRRRGGAAARIQRLVRGRLAAWRCAGEAAATVAACERAQRWWRNLRRERAVRLALFRELRGEWEAELRGAAVAVQRRVRGRFGRLRAASRRHRLEAEAHYSRRERAGRTTMQSSWS